MGAAWDAWMADDFISTLFSEGIIIDTEVKQFAERQGSPLQFVRHIASNLPEPRDIITMGEVRSVMREGALASEVRTSTERTSVRRAGEVEVLVDVTSETGCLATPDGNLRLFKDRFQRLKAMLLRRRDMAGATSIEKALDPNRLQGDGETKVIGMVFAVNETRSGDKVLTLEDDTGTMRVMVPKDNKAAKDSIVEDEVIGVSGKIVRRDRKMLLKELFRPDVPFSSGMELSDSTARVAFMSDIHVGSNTFLENRWKNMIAWLKDEAEELDLRYIVIPGDCVDGVGVFPGQEEELVLDDFLDQYHKLAEYLKDIPDGIRIVMQPGNHDVPRAPEPQPAMPSEVSGLFDSSVLQIGNPAYLRIEGRVILSYHGKSFDDWVNNIKGLSYTQPLKAMEEMLKRRHLAPSYGKKTQLAWEKQDYLLIDAVPDIFVTGHVHGAGVTSYKGIRMINASTWQDQTSFQRTHNFVPDPAKLIMVHLGTGRTSQADF